MTVLVTAIEIAVVFYLIKTAGGILGKLFDRLFEKGDKE